MNILYPSLFLTCQGPLDEDTTQEDPYQSAPLTG